MKKLTRTLLLLEARCCPTDRFTRTRGAVFLAKLSVFALILASALAQVGCRDGLIEPEIQPDAEPDTGCEFLFMAPPADAPFETEGMLTNLIIMEVRSTDEGDVETLTARIDDAARAVVGRFPAEIRDSLDMHFDAASARALDQLASAY